MPVPIRAASGAPSATSNVPFGPGRAQAPGGRTTRRPGPVTQPAAPTPPAGCRGHAGAQSPPRRRRRRNRLRQIRAAAVRTLPPARRQGAALRANGAKTLTPPPGPWGVSAGPGSRPCALSGSLGGESGRPAGPGPASRVEGRSEDSSQSIGSCHRPGLRAPVARSREGVGEGRGGARQLRGRSLLAERRLGTRTKLKWRVGGNHLRPREGGFAGPQVRQIRAHPGHVPTARAHSGAQRRRCCHRNTCSGALTSAHRLQRGRIFRQQCTHDVKCLSFIKHVPCTQDGAGHPDNPDLGICSLPSLPVPPLMQDLAIPLTSPKNPLTRELYLVDFFFFFEGL